MAAFLDFGKKCEEIKFFRGKTFWSILRVKQPVARMAAFWILVKSVKRSKFFESKNFWILLKSVKRSIFFAKTFCSILRVKQHVARMAAFWILVILSNSSKPAVAGRLFSLYNIFNIGISVGALTCFNALAREKSRQLFVHSLWQARVAMATAAWPEALRTIVTVRTCAGVLSFSPQKGSSMRCSVFGISVLPHVLTPTSSLLQVELELDERLHLRATFSSRRSRNEKRLVPCFLPICPRKTERKEIQ